MTTLVLILIHAESLIRAALVGATPAQKRRGLGRIRSILLALRVRVVGTTESPGVAWDVISSAYRDAARRERGGEDAPLSGRHIQSARKLFAAFVQRFDTALAHIYRDAASAFVGTSEEIEEVKGFTDKGGKRWDLSTYARMCARTIAAEAMSEATINRALDLGLDLVKVSKHVHPEDICSPYEGRIYSISGESNRYPKLTVRPPFHPNCRHTISIYIEG